MYNCLRRRFIEPFPLVYLRYDFDGIMEVTPGVKRAVREAAAALRSQGHEVVPFCPPGLPQVFASYMAFFMADGGNTFKKALQNGPADMDSIGIIYRSYMWPQWFKRIVALCLLPRVRESKQLDTGRPRITGCVFFSCSLACSSIRFGEAARPSGDGSSGRRTWSASSSWRTS